METKEDQPKSNEITNEKPSLGKLKKNGEPRKQLTEEQKARRVEILAKGRAIAHEKRRELERMKKENPPTIKSVPEPTTTRAEPKIQQDDNESEPETLKVMSIPKQKKKKTKGKKIIIMDESESSSSEEEVIIKKKKSKRKSTPPPMSEPPKPVAPPPPPKPVVPEPSQEEVDRLRRDKIRKMKEKERKDKLMSSIFN